MPPSERPTRRALLRAGAAAAVGLGGVGTASGLDDTVGDVTDAEVLQGTLERIPVPIVEDRTETVPVEALTERAEGIRPGSQLFADYGGEVGGCTANFIWREAGSNGDDEDVDLTDEVTDGPQTADAGTADLDGTLYIGSAGHCFLPEGADADEDAARDHEDGRDVEDITVTLCADCTFGGVTGLSIQGEVIELGDVVYARQTDPEEEGGDGVGHDFGLVEVPEEAEHLVDPTLPRFGGPHDVSEGAVSAGELINQYGAGIANGEVSLTQSSNGISLGDLGDDESWYAAVRASPGDSGSPIQASDLGSGLPQGSAAAGVLTHLTTGGTAGTTMGRSKEMVAEDIGLDIEVVRAGGL